MLVMLWKFIGMEYCWARRLLILRMLLFSCLLLMGLGGLIMLGFRRLGLRWIVMGCFWIRLG